MRIDTTSWLPPIGDTPLAALQVEHGPMRLVIVPERGGKIVSLYHLPTQTEWLWLNDELPWVTPVPTDSYIKQHDLGGWDECFPTVAPTTVEGRAWPDHGDLWWRRWDYEVQPDRLHMQTSGKEYRFERTLRAQGEALRFDYRVTNTGDSPLPYLWCAHPLFTVDPPLEIELLGRPPLMLGNDSVLGAAGEPHRWPTIQERTFRLVGKPSGLAAKLFIEVEVGEVALSHPSGVRWRARWPMGALPILGLWLNEGGWSGAGTTAYCNLGVEPATGAPDDLATALHQWKLARVVEPDESHHWWLEQHFETIP